MGLPTKFHKNVRVFDLNSGTNTEHISDPQYRAVIAFENATRGDDNKIGQQVEAETAKEARQLLIDTFDESILTNKSKVIDIVISDCEEV